MHATRSASATQRATVSCPRRRPVEQSRAGAALHAHDWDPSTNVRSNRVHKRTPEEAHVHAVARAIAAKERHQRLAKLPPPRPVQHTAAWNSSPNLNSKAVNKRTAGQASTLDVAQANTANDRRQRLSKLPPPRPVQHTAAWNSSTNVHSKAVPKQAAAARRDVKQVAHPCDRRAALPPSRPFAPVFPWNGSTNLASKQVNLPFQRPTRGADRRSSTPQPLARSARRSDAKPHEPKKLTLYTPPSCSKARVLVHAA